MSAETLQTEEKHAKKQRLIYVIEILLAATIFAVTSVGLSLLDFNFAANIAVVITILGIWAMRHRQGGSWTDFGLKRPQHGIRFVLLVLAAVATTAILVMVIMPLLYRLTGPLESSGDTSLYQSPLSFVSYLLLIAWGAAALGEELLFRGFLLNHVAHLFGRSKIGWAVALLFQAVLFGLAHYKHGLAAITLTGLIGLSFGVFYLLAGRNLWCVIVAHGIIDTISLTQDYLGGH